MDGSGYSPTPYDTGVGGSMKAFLLLVMVFSAIIIIASTSLANVDLTPDTAAAYVVPPTGSEVTVVEGYEIVAIQDDTIKTYDGGTGADFGAVPVPVTGSCSNPYTIRQGDSLSSISVLCDTSMAEIRLANPEIVNANLIYAGQQIRIPNAPAGAAANQTVPVPVTSGETLPQEAPQVVTNPLGSQDYGATAIRPVTGVQVTGIDFPSNVPVYIAIGPQNTGYTIAASAVTDAEGRVVSEIIVPTAPDPNEPWVIVIATSDSPVIQAASEPFLIQP